jgi:hypothetical protein
MSQQRQGLGQMTSNPINPMELQFNGFADLLLAQTQKVEEVKPIYPETSKYKIRAEDIEAAIYRYTVEFSQKTILSIAYQEVDDERSTTGVIVTMPDDRMAEWHALGGENFQDDFEIQRWTSYGRRIGAAVSMSDEALNKMNRFGIQWWRLKILQMQRSIYKRQAWYLLTEIRKKAVDVTNNVLKKELYGKKVDAYKVYNNYVAMAQKQAKGLATLIKTLEDMLSVKENCSYDRFLVPNKLVTTLRNVNIPNLKVEYFKGDFAEKFQDMSTYFTFMQKEWFAISEKVAEYTGFNLVSHLTFLGQFPFYLEESRWSEDLNLHPYDSKEMTIKAWDVKNSKKKILSMMDVITYSEKFMANGEYKFQDDQIKDHLRPDDDENPFQRKHKAYKNFVINVVKSKLNKSLDKKQIPERIDNLFEVLSKFMDITPKKINTYKKSVRANKLNSYERVSFNPSKTVITKVETGTGERTDTKEDESEDIEILKKNVKSLTSSIEEINGKLEDMPTGTTGLVKKDDLNSIMENIKAAHEEINTVKKTMESVDISKYATKNDLTVINDSLKELSEQNKQLNITDTSLANNFNKMNSELSKLINKFTEMTEKKKKKKEKKEKEKEKEEKKEKKKTKKKEKPKKEEKKPEKPKKEEKPKEEKPKEKEIIIVETKEPTNYSDMYDISQKITPEQIEIIKKDVNEIGSIKSAINRYYSNMDENGIKESLDTNFNNLDYNEEGIKELKENIPTKLSSLAVSRDDKDHSYGLIEFMSIIRLLWLTSSPLLEDKMKNPDVLSPYSINSMNIIQQIYCSDISPGRWLTPTLTGEEKMSIEQINDIAELNKKNRSYDVGTIVIKDYCNPESPNFINFELAMFVKENYPNSKVSESDGAILGEMKSDYNKYTEFFSKLSVKPNQDVIDKFKARLDAHSKQCKDIFGDAEAKKKVINEEIKFGQQRKGVLVSKSKMSSRTKDKLPLPLPVKIVGENNYDDDSVQLLEREMDNWIWELYENIKITISSMEKLFKENIPLPFEGYAIRYHVLETISAILIDSSDKEAIKMVLGNFLVHDEQSYSRQESSLRTSFTMRVDINPYRVHKVNHLAISNSKIPPGLNFMDPIQQKKYRNIEKAEDKFDPVHGSFGQNEEKGEFLLALLCPIGTEIPPYTDLTGTQHFLINNSLYDENTKQEFNIDEFLDFWNIKDYDVTYNLKKLPNSDERITVKANTQMGRECHSRWNPATRDYTDHVDGTTPLGNIGCDEQSSKIFSGIMTDLTDGISVK